MQKELIKTLKRKFARLVKERLPQFVLQKTDDPQLEGHPLYRWDVASDLCMFLMLKPDQKSNRFTVEVGWSENGRYKRYGMHPWDPPHNGIVGFRIARLLNMLSDVWWDAEPNWSEEFRQQLRERRFQPPPVKPLIPVVEELANDAFDKVLAYALPYFREIAKQHGYDVSGAAGVPPDKDPREAAAPAADPVD